MAYNNNGNSLQKTAPVVFNLIIINTLVFAAQWVMDKQGDMLTINIALFPIDSPYFKPHQIITHMFAHGGLGHIFFNMFTLFMFGSSLERFWGSKKFLLFYMICGLGSAVALLGMDYLGISRFFFAVGASGAIMGLMAAFAYLFPNTQLLIFPFPFPVKAKWAIPVLMAIDLFGGFATIPGDNIAHFAHLGGALTGFIIVLIWNKTNRRTFY
ncbi:MAG: rhomboid family intramembrane serine protease [Chitinophagaceae bacterium]